MTLDKASIFLQTGYLDKVPELFLLLPGIKDESVILQIVLSTSVSSTKGHKGRKTQGM